MPAPVQSPSAPAPVLAVAHFAGQEAARNGRPRAADACPNLARFLAAPVAASHVAELSRAWVKGYDEAERGMDLPRPADDETADEYLHPGPTGFGELREHFCQDPATW